MVDDWAAAALTGGQVPTCSGEAGFAVQAVRLEHTPTPSSCRSSFTLSVCLCALMAKAMDAAKISAMEGRQVSVEALDEA